jgi:hypothetical protein
MGMCIGGNLVEHVPQSCPPVHSGTG